MQVYLLGNGNAFGLSTSTSFLIRNQDCACLIDCPHKLHNVLADFADKTGTSISADDITHIIITHNHGDHVSGLELMLRMRLVRGGPKPVIVTTKAICDDLWNGILHGSLSYHFNDAHECLRMTASDYYEFLEVEPGKEISFGGISLSVRSNIHPGPTIGVRLRDAGHAFSYSGDCVYDPDVIRKYYNRGSISEDAYEDLLGFVWDSPVVFHDCAADADPVHTHLSDLLALPEEVRQRIRLVNLPDDFDTFELRKAEIYRDYSLQMGLA